MFRRHIELAISKAQSDAQRDALHPIVLIAAALDEQEQTFEARMNASKAARGEGPTRLSKSKRSEVDRYAADAREMGEEQLREFAELDDPWLIVFSLHAGMVHDVDFWSKPDPGGHPSDAVIVREFLQAKIELRDALAAYLAQFPGSEDDD